VGNRCQASAGEIKSIAAKGVPRWLSRADIGAALGPLNGSKRANATKALRSLFSFTKKRGLIFANPTTGLKARPVDTTPSTAGSTTAAPPG
jgi:hypothetical protein